MNKKIKITENQFERLRSKLLVETPYNKMVNDIQVGDIVSILWKGSKNNFKVIDNTSGHIIMDNIDAGSANINYRYLMIFTSLHGDDLELRRVHKEKEKENLNDFKKWKPLTVKDISDILIIRDGKVIDRVDPVNPTAAKQQNKTKDGKSTQEPEFDNEINNQIGILLEDLNEGNGLRLVFNNGDVFFCCMNKFGSSTESLYVLEINKEKNSILPNLNDWDSFVLELKGNPDDENLYKLNKDVVTTNDNGKTFNLKFKVNAGNTTKGVIVYSINGLGVLPNCEGEETPDEGKEIPSEIGYDKEAIYNMVLTDQRLKNAFYKQPNFWNHFVSALKGEKPLGTGFLPILDILSRYNNDELAKKIGEGFNYKGEVLFRPLAPLVVRYENQKGGFGAYRLDTVNPTAIDIRRFELNEVSKVLIKNLNDPDNPTYKVRILVKEKTDDPNIKICDVQIVNEKYTNKFIIVGEQQNQNLEFLESEGYKSQSKSNTK